MSEKGPKSKDLPSLPATGLTAKKYVEPDLKSDNVTFIGSLMELMFVNFFQEVPGLLLLLNVNSS